MKKCWIISLWVLMLSPFTFAFSSSDLVNLLQQPQNIQGHFTQQRFLNALEKPINSSGQFTLVKNHGLLWQMQKPFKTEMRVNVDGISQWNGASWVTHNRMGQSQQVQLFLGLLSGNVESLNGQFTFHLSGSEKHWKLTLTPSSLLMKQIFEYIEIQGDNAVKQIELFEKQGDRSVIYFEQLQFNQALSEFAQSALQ